MIPYNKKEEVEPILKLSKSIGAIEKNFILESPDQQYNIIELFEKKLYEKYKQGELETSLFQKYFKYINPKKTDVNSLIGKWAWFPDISIQLGFQEAFGIIYGARDTNSWQGMTYFIKRPHIKSMLQIANSSVLLFDFECEEVLKFNKQEDNIQELFNLLNIYCEFLHNDEWKIGQINSFDLNVVTIKYEKDKYFNLSVKDYKEKTRNFQEEISDLSFVITRY